MQHQLPERSLTVQTLLKQRPDQVQGKERMHRSSCEAQLLLPVIGGQALLEGLDKGVYPVVAQHHALRETDVELFHGSE